MCKEKKIDIVFRNYANIVQWLKSINFKPGFRVNVKEYDFICKHPYISGRELTVIGPHASASTGESTIMARSQARRVIVLRLLMEAKYL